MSVPGEVKVHEHCSLLTAADVPGVIPRLASESWEVWESATHPQEPKGQPLSNVEGFIIFLSQSLVLHAALPFHFPSLSHQTSDHCSSHFCTYHFRLSFAFLSLL